MYLSHLLFFFFNAPPTTEIYTLSLHDALPISDLRQVEGIAEVEGGLAFLEGLERVRHFVVRSEEHTSELQSLRHLVCRLLLEKKKQQKMQLLQYDSNDTYYRSTRVTHMDTYST